MTIQPRVALFRQKVFRTETVFHFQLFSKRNSTVSFFSCLWLYTRILLSAFGKHSLLSVRPQGCFISFPIFIFESLNFTMETILHLHCKCKISFLLYSLQCACKHIHKVVYFCQKQNMLDKIHHKTSSSYISLFLITSTAHDDFLAFSFTECSQ